MAGYIFLLRELKYLKDRIVSGVYSTIIKDPAKNYWSTAIESTIGDYLTMKQGDNVYFFSKRKIYGIGELINIGDAVRLQNYSNSIEPKKNSYEVIKDELLFNFGRTSFKNRLICFFNPAPHFFKIGIDMDDVLMSDPSKFKMLRFIQNVSFIKIDDEENQALKNIILKRNIDAVTDPNNKKVYKTKYKEIHEKIRVNITESHTIKLRELIDPFVENGYIKHEMLIEIAILKQLIDNDNPTIEVFGSWDYLSHQVGASPFKPVAYIDRIDIFGYKYLDKLFPTIGSYVIIEIKKGEANKQDLTQLMKYVDWVKSEYASGDYSNIKAFLVANTFHDNINNDVVEEITTRNFIYGSRPSKHKTWNDVSLITYNYNEKEGKLNFLAHEIAL